MVWILLEGCEENFCLPITRSVQLTISSNDFQSGLFSRNLRIESSPRIHSVGVFSFFSSLLSEKGARSLKGSKLFSIMLEIMCDFPLRHQELGESASNNRLYCCHMVYFGALGYCLPSYCSPSYYSVFSGLGILGSLTIHSCYTDNLGLLVHVWHLETGFCFVVQTSLEFSTILPQPPMCQDYRCLL